MRNIRGAGTADVFLGDDKNRSRYLRQFLFFFRNRGHLDIHQVFQTPVRQVNFVLLGPGRSGMRRDQQSTRNPAE
jgi:hypothetical protein